MTTPHLIYFADPMCSWCWGFSGVIAAIEEVWGADLPIRLVLGGLRPGVTEAMTDKAKETLRGHWREVAEASGRPFGPSGLDAPGFVYDTDPAARAVVLMRALAPSQALAFLARLQRAFYSEGVDITDLEALGALAEDFGQDRAAFATALADEDLKRETWRDYAISQNAGVAGFPTLILGPRAEGAYLPITRGFQPMAVVLPSIASQLAALA
jgi:putative protein-disulfide isomerase